MAVCVTVNSVDSVLVLSATPLNSCTDYVLYTAADYSLLAPIYTPSDIVEISTGVVLAWAAAWSFKILRRSL